MSCFLTALKQLLENFRVLMAKFKYSVLILYSFKKPTASQLSIIKSLTQVLAAVSGMLTEKH